MYKYKDVIFEDIEKKIEDGLNDWSGICQECVNKHNIDHNKLDSGGSGCCMVLNCLNEADYYIDFEDGEFEEITECNINAEEFCKRCDVIIKEEYGEEIHTYILHNGEGYLDLYLAEDQDEISEKLYKDTEGSAEFLDNMVEKMYGKGYSAVYQNDVKNMGYEVDEITITAPKNRFITS